MRNYFWRVLTGTGCFVPKTLELGTTAGRAGICGETPKSIFLNCVLKHVFRFGSERVSGMNMFTTSTNILGLNGHNSPCRFTYLCVKEPALGLSNTSMLAMRVLKNWPAIPIRLPMKVAEGIFPRVQGDHLCQRKSRSSDAL